MYIETTKRIQMCVLKFVHLLYSFDHVEKTFFTVSINIDVPYPLICMYTQVYIYIHIPILKMYKYYVHVPCKAFCNTVRNLTVNVSPYSIQSFRFPTKFCGP